MAWFAAHAIYYFKLREGEQNVFPIWENVYLIEAANTDEAWEKAEAWAKESDGNDEMLTLNDKPAKYIYAGIRKLITVSHWDEEGTLRHRDEITYSEFNVFNEEDVKRLVNGEEVEIEYVE